MGGGIFFFLFLLLTVPFGLSARCAGSCVSKLYCVDCASVRITVLGIYGRSVTPRFLLYSTSFVRAAFTFLIGISSLVCHHIVRLSIISRLNLCILYDQRFKVWYRHNPSCDHRELYLAPKVTRYLTYQLIVS